MNILLAGGNGFIGSHTVVELLNSGHQVVIADNLINSDLSVLDKINEITDKKPRFYEIDLCNQAKLNELFQNEKIDAVIHFAGLKAVGESTEKPLEYYQNNLISTLNLLQSMKDSNVKNLIFSSSATVYGSSSETNPRLTEIDQTGPGISSPYGKTKYMIEEILKDFSVANSDFNITILRYANPIGAHNSGLIGENPEGIPNNLLPFIAQVASGQREFLGIFGDDYPTPDGTCIRDYIHVVDLAKGHLAAMNKFDKLQVYNIGTGKGVSVKEIVKDFEFATGVNIPFKTMPRRAGDLPEYFLDASKANKELNWQATKSIQDACADSWRFQKKLTTKN